MVNESSVFQQITELIIRKQLSVTEEYKLKEFLNRVLINGRKCLAYL